MFSCVFITQQVLNLNGDSDFYNSPPLRYPAESCRTLRAQDPSKHSSLSMLKTCDASTSRITSRPRQHLSDTCDIGKFWYCTPAAWCCLTLMVVEKNIENSLSHQQMFSLFRLTAVHDILRNYFAQLKPRTSMCRVLRTNLLQTLREVSRTPGFWVYIGKHSGKFRVLAEALYLSHLSAIFLNFCWKVLKVAAGSDEGKPGGNKWVQSTSSPKILGQHTQSHT